MLAASLSALQEIELPYIHTAVHLVNAGTNSIPFASIHFQDVLPCTGLSWVWKQNRIQRESDLKARVDRRSLGSRSSSQPVSLHTLPQYLAISNSKWQLLMLPKAAGYLSTQQRNEMGSLLALLLKSEHLAGASTGEAQVNFRSNTIIVSVNITFKLPKLNAPFWYLIS